MRDFKPFIEAVSKQFAEMVKAGTLFGTDSDKDVLWETYMESWPTGTNNMYRERREYECNACRSFIKRAGGIVAFKRDYWTSYSNDDIMTVWDLATKLDIEPYRVVAEAMREYVLSREIENQFFSSEPVAGVQKNIVQPDGKEVQTWYHFFVNFPRELVLSHEVIGTKRAEVRSTYDVLLRGMSELKLEDIDTLLELIGQNSLYRGEEHLKNLQRYRKIKADFPKTGAEKQRNYCWAQTVSLHPSVLRLRNTSIGQLLIHLSEGMDLEMAVKKFEEMVAPANYKRPTALITSSMIERARKQCDELGLTSALDRRHAKLSDISAGDIIFADRSLGGALQTKNGFDALAASVPDKPRGNFDKVEEIHITKFLTDVLPKASGIEVLVEGRHNKNLFSLIAPCDPTCGKLFQWDNNHSWSYNGELADSNIKERVKAAGGNIDAEVCFRLAWNNYDDLDLHLREHSGYEIFYQNKGRLSPCGGMLDVDMNAGSGSTREPVENIFYKDISQMREGIYRLFVNQYCARESHDVGFEIEADICGDVISMNYPKALKTGERVNVLTFEYRRNGGIKVLESLESSVVSKEIWGIHTNKFIPVSLVMFSPNHWENSGSNTGNKHVFFILDGCKNPMPTRGFYNEFLRADLHDHRKVFEVLGSKMKAEVSDEQLSGLGFSSTIRESVVVRVKGNFNRTVKVTF